MVQKKYRLIRQRDGVQAILPVIGRGGFSFSSRLLPVLS
jgi:hypothetical protein